VRVEAVVTHLTTEKRTLAYGLDHQHPDDHGRHGPRLGVVIWLARVGERVATNAAHIEELQQHKDSTHKDIRLEIQAIRASVTVLSSE
jgi:hypothetical protein